MSVAASDRGASPSYQPESGDIDAQIKLAGLEIKKAEALKIRAEIGKGHVNWAVFGPLLAAVGVALIGMISTIYVAWMNGRSQTELEALKAKTTLIIEAVKTGSQDPMVARRNIKFFLEAGLLSDPDGSIARFVEEGNLPVFAMTVSGFKVTFDDETSLDQLTGADKSRVLALIHGLDPKEFVRLMYVGQLKNLCEFDKPSTEMLNDVALDYGLRDKGLTKIEVNPATLESVRAESDKMVAQGKNLDIGYPRTCYDMTLTADGYNVKTALVKHLSKTFDDRRHPFAPE